MTVNELFNNRMIVSNIPLVYEGRELSAKLQAKLMIMRVSYDKAVSAFQDKMKEVSNGLKPEGYNDIEREITKMLEIEGKEKDFKEWNGEGTKPYEPTKEELEEAKKIRTEKYEDFEAKKAVLVEKINEAYLQEGKEQADIKVKMLTEEDYAEIISVVKTDGLINYIGYNGKKIHAADGGIPKIDFLGLIAASLVE
ncbi:MAG: hypothetical protein IKU15_07815 [Clostridia bacterium]|nr:hypothetical protein [Clostridia bacterium]